MPPAKVAPAGPLAEGEVGAAKVKKKKKKEEDGEEKPKGPKKKGNDPEK